ncbi:neuferricin [Vanessa atalanta]|uniref:neuferricin n=1 Tax=Vanessa atalanta TaxID=42275 RepID=UPI001FCCE243|nr:neuferricin [Vanessa atalanta]
MFLTLCSKSNLKYIIITVTIAITAIILRKYNFTLKTDDDKLKRTNGPLVFSYDELAKYDGIYIDKLYLSVIGSIFDVTEGKKYYAKGSPYHYFVGKDGTRALVTGDFKDESSNKDHVLELSCDDVSTILHWRQTYREKYKFIGLLAGRYYDENGLETSYMSEFKHKIKLCKKEKEEAKNQDKLYPPCNISWSEEEGTRVWCTKTSGGIERGWVGVPRQLFTPGVEKPRCVCVNLEKNNSSMLKEYEGCPIKSTYCVFKD